MCMQLFWWDEFSFKSNCPELGFTTFGHIFFIKWSVSLHSQLQDNKTTSIPPHLSLHPISRYLSSTEQDKSASLSVLLDHDNWSVAGFVVLRTAISLSGQHNRTHKLSHATAAGLFQVHGLTLLVKAVLNYNCKSIVCLPAGASAFLPPTDQRVFIRG